MSRRLFIAYVLEVAFCLLHSSGEAYAAEIRIVDPRGLTRALKTLANSSRINATVKASFAAAAGRCPLVLSNIDGLNGDVSGVGHDGWCVFPGVTSGNWQLKTLEQNIVVQEVRIEETGEKGAVNSP